MENSDVKIVAVNGSVRPGNYTGKVLALCVDELVKNNVPVKVIDPAMLSLPMPGHKADPDDSRKLQNAIKNATGVIISTPEYNGSYSSVIKLVIENLGFPSALLGKPVTLVGVASGQIGAVKALEHLRSVCSHVGAIVLPSTVSVAAVDKFFTKTSVCTNEALEKRIRGAATRLLDYIKNNVCPRYALEQFARLEGR